MKIRPWRHLFLLSILATACGPGPGGDLKGEWIIRITATSFDGRAVSDRVIAGVLVFDNSLPLWAPEETLGFGPPYENGRMFAPVARLAHGPVRDSVPGVQYRIDGSTALAYEVVGKAADSQVSFVLAPGIIGGRFEFSGTVNGDTVRGKWRMPPHPTSMEGTFTMWRAPNQAAHDSARAQARRVADHTQSPPGVSFDTLSPP
jgi:hypothetical protein